MAYQGTRCQICTGCGRCAPAGRQERDMRVITDTFHLPGKTQLGQREEEIAAADLGTTTIAMEWYDRQGRKQGEYVRSNPQRIFGTDVISRIQSAENPMLRRQMQQLVRGVLEEGINYFRQQGGEPRQMVIAGNTTMMYLLLGHDPAQLGAAPFTADYLAGERLMICGVEAVTLPGLSAFIGGDITAGILACEMDLQEEITLLVDLGTNGEMVLGNRGKLLCCAAAAGPAFEGGSDIWGADMIALTARLQQLGLVDETGLLAEPYFEQGITVGNVRITQERIRQLQTAKAAVCAGIRTLSCAYGLTGPEQIKQVYLAGGFGYFLDVQAALSLGLLPRELEGRIKAVGNSALAGAWLYGREGDAGVRMERICQNARVLNLAQQQDFGPEFTEAMYLRRI